MMSAADDMNIVSTIISPLFAQAQGGRRRRGDREQMKVLKLLRCDEGQGYLFNRPLPAQGIERLLALPAA